MLMHEWIRYRNQQVKRTSDEEGEGGDAPAEERGPEDVAEAAPAEPELVLAPDEETPEEPAVEEVEAAAEATPEAQAPPGDAESTDRERERVLSSLHEELERAGQSIRERVRQLQARQKQLPIEMEEPAEDDDEERPRRASETRQELVQRLLDPTLTLREASLLLDVCPTTVRRYTNRGLLSCFRTPGNQRRFHLSDVLEFMERREQDEV